MNDDGGIYWFQTVAEEQEYLEYLEELNKLNDGFNAHPVKSEFEKEQENGIHCKR